MCAENWWIISCLLHCCFTALPQQRSDVAQTTWEAHLGAQCHPVSGSPRGCRGAACWGTHSGLCAGAGMGTGLEGAGQASVPTQPCPVLQTCTRGGGTTPWRRWLEEAPFDAVDNKWLEGRGSLQFLSGLTWHVDAHCSPVQGTSAVLTATQRLLKLSQECHNGNSKGLSL